MPLGGCVTYSIRSPQVPQGKASIWPGLSPRLLFQGSVCKQTAGICKLFAELTDHGGISLKILLSLPPSPAALCLGLGHASPPNPVG